MSGLAAAYRHESSIDPDVLQKMISAIAHRGPDGETVWTDGEIGLASCLLKTTPESMGEAGIPSDDGERHRVIWDGRIDNRQELLGSLENGARFTTRPDPELFLAAYHRWGTDCLAKVVGDFAFALWDFKSCTLFCGRDRMGVRPFYYTWDGRTFYMASEAKALFQALGKIPATEDEMILAFLSYRNFSDEDHGRTFFHGIRRLPPAHFLVVGAGRLQIRRYWSIDPGRILRYTREEDTIDHFRNLFREAVRCRLRSNRDPSFFLSGGLDSSAVTCMAARIVSQESGDPSRLQAVNLFCADALSDERAYAGEVSKRTGIRLHSLLSHTPDPLKGLDEFLWKAEAPFVSTSRNLEPYEFLRERNVRVVLTGDGGDQLLDEDGFLADLLARFRLFRFVRETLRYSQFLGESFLNLSGRAYETAFLTRSALAEIVPPSWLARLRRFRKNVPPPWINPSSSQEADLRARILTPRKRLPFHCLGQASSYRAVTEPYFVLKQELDERIHAHHGMEIRYPLLDSRLVEFVLSIPWQHRVTGERKRLIRRSMRGIVPDEILGRKDKGCTTQEADAGLKALCRKDPPEPVRNCSGRMGRYADLGNARRVVEDYLTVNKRLRFEVWFLVTVDHWLKQFNPRSIDGHTAAPQEKEVSLAESGSVRGF